jgi:type II secretory pathway component PulF
MGQQQLTVSDASDLIWVCRRLAAALQGDHSVVAALDASVAELALQSRRLCDARATPDPSRPTPRARQFLGTMRQALAGGRKMGQALLELGLPSFAGGLVWSGELGGPDRLAASLTRLAEQLQFEQQLGEPRDPRLLAYGLALSRLGAMLQGHVMALQALDAAAESAVEPQVKTALHEVRVAVAEGLPLGTALPMATDDLPSPVIEMIEEGEAAGRLGEVLAIAADYLFDEAGRKEA